MLRWTESCSENGARLDPRDASPFERKGKTRGVTCSQSEDAMLDPVSKKGRLFASSESAVKSIAHDARHGVAEVPPPAPASPRAPAPASRTQRAPKEPRIERIARRAHEIYVARGGEHGKALDDWLRAEREIDAEDDQ